MKQIKIRAGLYLASTALYIWMAAVLDKVGLCLPLVFALVVGIFCGYNCLLCGQDLERERRKELDEQRDACDEIATGERIRCKNCGCQEFRIIAGRLICNCCGEVTDVDT